MPRDTIELDALFFEHDIAPDFERAETRIKLRAHKIRKAHLRNVFSHEERSAFFDFGHVLVGYVVIRKQAAAIFFALFRLEI